MDNITHCKRCGRPLKAEWSTKRGIGRSCRKKLAHEEWLKNQLTIYDFIPDERLMEGAEYERTT